MNQLEITDIERKVDDVDFVPYLECKLKISLEFIQDLRALPAVIRIDMLGQELQSGIEEAWKVSGLAV